MGEESCLSPPPGGEMIESLQVPFGPILAAGFWAYHLQITAALGRKRSNKEVFPAPGKQKEWTSACRHRVRRSCS